MLKREQNSSLWQKMLDFVIANKDISRATFELKCKQSLTQSESNVIILLELINV